MKPARISALLFVGGASLNAGLHLLGVPLGLMLGGELVLLGVIVLSAAAAGALS